MLCWAGTKFCSFWSTMVAINVATCRLPGLVAVLLSVPLVIATLVELSGG